jgi:Phage Mu protein F like protein
VRKFGKDDSPDTEGDRIARDLSLVALLPIGNIDAYLSDVAGNSGNWFLAQVNVPSRDDLFGQVNGRAVAWAKENGGELVSGIEDTTRSDMASLISKGLQENIGLDAIADRIASAYSFSEDRADLIARDQVARANQQGALLGMREAQKAGVKLKKEWVPDADACEDCTENGDEGPIDLDEQFPSEDDTAPAHPNCRCSVVSVVEEEKDSDDDDEE